LARQLAGKDDAQICSDEDLLPLPEVANKLDCGERTVWRLVAGGELSDPVHVRGSAKWFRQDVREYLRRIRAKRGK
jgi:predicted DNA-binding transcriptional regulator AlpA